MSSSYSKLLWPVTVTSVNQTFGFSDSAARSVDIPIARYSTILHVAQTLQNIMNSVSSGYTISVSEIGTTTISRTTNWAMRWAVTDNALSTMFGYSETEAKTSYSYIGSSQHTHAWYPGNITFNRSLTRGIGVSQDSRWKDQYPAKLQVKTISGAQYIIAPSTPIRRRLIAYSYVAKDEVDNTSIGVRAINSDAYPYVMYWYPDRSVGNVGSYGAVNSETGHYLVSMNKEVDYDAASDPRYYIVRLDLNMEPS